MKNAEIQVTELLNVKSSTSSSIQKDKTIPVHASFLTKDTKIFVKKLNIAKLNYPLNSITCTFNFRCKGNKTRTHSNGQQNNVRERVA